MSETVVRWAIVAGAAIVVFALVTLVQRRVGRKSRRQSIGGGTRQPEGAVHLPADDPLWQQHVKALNATPEHKRVKRAARARRRQKSTASWAAGGVAGGSTDGFDGGGCGGGGGGCGGGS